MRAVDGHAGTVQKQVGNSTDMIDMMMRYEDRCEFETVLVECCDDRRCFARIHNDSATLSVFDQPDIVVGKGRQRTCCKHGRHESVMWGP